MKTCEHFEYPMKVTVTFDDMVGMRCPLCQARNYVENGFLKIRNCSRITEDKARKWLEDFQKQIEGGSL